MARRKGEGQQRGVTEDPPGSGRYRVDYCDQWGKAHREILYGKREAEDRYLLRKAEVREGSFNPECLSRKKREVPIQERTVSEAIDLVLAESRTNLVSYRDDERYGRYWKEELGSKTLGQVLPEDIKRWRRRRLEIDKVSPATVNRAVSFLRKVYYDAIDNGYSGPNVVAKLGSRRGKKRVMLDENNERDVCLTAAQEEALFKVFNRAEWLKVELAIHTGMRQGNLFGMRREWVDFHTGLIRIPSSSIRKKGRPHLVKMNSRVATILKHLLARHDSPWVFPSLRSGMDCHESADRWVARFWEPALKAAGIQGLHFHDLRATCATRLFEDGATPEEVRDQLGHSTLQMVQRYARVVEDHQRMAVERMAQRSTRPLFE